MAKAALFGCVLVGALYVSIALGTNVVAITGVAQHQIQLNDSETLEEVQTILVERLQFRGIKLLQLVSLGEYVYVTAVWNLQSIILQYEILPTTNTLEFVKYETFASLCIQPLALTASYDYSDQLALALACSETALVVDPETLEITGIFILPEISGISVETVVDVALSANYIYVTFTTKPQSDDDKSEGLLVQFSRTTLAVVNWSIVRGQSSHLQIAGSSELFLTSSGNGASYLSQLNPKTLEEIDRVNPQGFEFLQMTMTPDLKSLFMYIQKSGLNAGRVRNFDQTVYPAEKSCADVRIEMSPASQPIVTDHYLFIRSSTSMTRFTFDDLGCPRQGTQTSYALDLPADSSGVAIACRECLSIS
ncbi:hypothetical protein NDN08_005581 [Rhodosorus marinus]|uniref:Uncharacterized protein n=1 Tax=Rhodosorus marinus TaxID=101924 RepID=A0AAV8V4Y0_9RHOD|nr:hypothetical protein NDN08_005581 [Rhodosorus marinus]